MAFLCSAVFSGVVPHAGAATVRREVPVRFGWPASYSPLDLDTGWLPFPANPLLQQFRGYVRANAVPYAFAACGKLVFSFDPALVYPGNTFPCSVWMEPYDAADLTEIRSDFGCEFGIEVRDRWTEVNLASFSKDFLIAIEGHGGLPLGTSTIGGWDTLEYTSIPVDEFLPKSDIVKLTQGLLDVLDANGISTGIGELDLVGELVVHGNRLNLRVGETDITLTNAGAASAQTAMVHVPLELGDTLADTFEIPLIPYYNFTLYKGMGLKLTAFGPLSLTLGYNRVIPPGGYTPPPLSLLESDYQRAVDGATVSSDESLWVSFPVNGRPLLPDLAIHDIVINPGEPAVHGKAYANELTMIAFTLSNVGGAPTLSTDELVVKFLVNGVTVREQVLNNRGSAPSLILGTNQSIRLAFTETFTEGAHNIELRSGHAMLKGDDHGQPVYGMGDPFFGNHMKRLQVYAAPPRGSVIGRLFGNPDYPGDGIDGIPVRLNGLYRSLVCTSAYDTAAASHGMYRFNGVPAGEYLLEILPPAPTNAVGPRYWPRSLRFTHAGDGVTDLTDGSGLFMRQYQRLHGKVNGKELPPGGEPVSNVTIRLCAASLQETRTDPDGRFVFTNIPPTGRFLLAFDHPAFLLKQVQVNMGVDFTAQTDTTIPGYVELPGMTWVDGNTILIEEDTTPPDISLEPFDNDGRRSTPMTFAFHGSDQNGRFNPALYRWQVRAPDGFLLLEEYWTPWPTNVPPGHRATATADLSWLTNGAYRFELNAADRAGNQATTPAQWITLDKTPPQITATVAGGAAVTASRLVPVSVAITNTEPGTLTLELSNDGITWSAPWRFSSNTFTVSDWEISGRDTGSGAVTVHARVTDAVGLQATASDSIDFATVGAIRLAYGWEAWTNTSVPLEIGITPPDGVFLKRLSTYAGSLAVGGHPQAVCHAQAFVLTNAITFNRIRICYADTIGEPPPLAVRVVPALDNADPSGAASALWSWSATAEQVRAMAFVHNGLIPAQSGAGTVLPAGTNYVIFTCDSTNSGHRYLLYAGDRRYNMDGGLRHSYTNGTWIAAPEYSTLAFELWNSPNGEIRVCTDGTPDTEPWTAFPYPDDPYRTVTAPGQGCFTTIVNYRNTTDPSRDGTHIDTVIIDMTPPAVSAVTLQTIDTRSRGVLMDLDVSDAHTRVAAMKWRFDNSPWEGDAFRRNPFLFCPPSFGTMSWSFIDAAGNETPPVTRAFSVDMSAPTLSATAEAGAAYTRNTELAWRFTAQDDGKLGHIALRESRTGTNYPAIDPRTRDMTLPLPQCVVGDSEGRPVYDWVDGAYAFEAVAYDAASNASPTVLIPVTLDRRPPVLDHATLTGSAGESPVTGTNLLLTVSATDAIGPMELRWRWKGAPWSAWLPLSGGRAGLALAGFTPPPLQYEVDIEVRDAAGWTVAASCGVEVNRPPATPSGIRPAGGTGAPPLLFGSEFSDPDADAWHASQFAVRDRETILLDTGALDDTDRYTVPADWLSREHKYQWRCRYLDTHGAWSAWSQWLSFDCQADTDGDGIPDDIELMAGTGRDDPDSDGDRIPDGLEDLNANGVVEPGETDPRSADSDGDGLADNEEDTDANARLGPDETSPSMADTDGDRAGDRHERLAGTDPRDASASFRVTSFETLLPDGRRRISWQGRGGSSYSVMTEHTLGDEAPPVAVTNITATGGIAPWHVVPMTWTEPAHSPSNRFYAILIQ